MVTKSVSFGPSEIHQKRQLAISFPSASVSFSCYPFSLTRFGATDSPPNRAGPQQGGHPAPQRAEGARPPRNPAHRRRTRQRVGLWYGCIYFSLRERDPYILTYWQTSSCCPHASCVYAGMRACMSAYICTCMCARMQMHPYSWITTDVMKSLVCACLLTISTQLCWDHEQTTSSRGSRWHSMNHPCTLFDKTPVTFSRHYDIRHANQNAACDQKQHRRIGPEVRCSSRVTTRVIKLGASDRRSWRDRAGGVRVAMRQCAAPQWL